jgi:hypothetical protein
MSKVTQVRPLTDVKKLAEKRHQFLNVSYSGTHLQHPLSTYGTWRVRGEDPNCDLGGSHHMPELGLFQGTLSDVVDIAVMLPQFWQWGGGGDITLISIVKTEDYTAAKVSALKEERAELLKRVSEINAVIGA